MVYVCSECKREIKSIENGVGCPYCGGRMIKKKRSGIAREVSTD